MPISEEAQLQRRRRLLSQTRQMIREVGVENLNVRELAKYCGISVPTIYNQFINKDHLIQSAADELYRAYYEDLAEVDYQCTLSEVIELTDNTVDLLLQNPELSALFIRRYSAPKGGGGAGLALYKRILKGMKLRGDILEWVDLDLLAVSAYHRVGAVVVSWSVGKVTEDQLKSFRRHELFLCLLGVTSEPIRNVVKERYISELETIRH